MRRHEARTDALISRTWLLLSGPLASLSGPRCVAMPTGTVKKAVSTSVVPSPLMNTSLEADAHNQKRRGQTGADTD